METALKSVDGHAGFNIELKWDMELADGSRESHNAFELNLFVDTILKTVLEHGNKRKIVFSSFNPGWLTHDQSNFPKLFGEKPFWCFYVSAKKTPRRLFSKSTSIRPFPKPSLKVLKVSFLDVL